jgi:hypothetical protein
MKPFVVILAICVISCGVSRGQRLSADDARKVKDYADKQAADKEKLDKKKAEARARYTKLTEAGRRMFGTHVRYTITKGAEYAGTLLEKPVDEFGIGDWGCSLVEFRVVNKVSDTELLASAGSAVVLFRGLDTKKATDGVEFILQYPLVIQETYSYAAVSGAKKTVLVLEANNEKKVDELVAAERERVESERAEAEAATYRTWKIGDDTFVGNFVEIKTNKVRLKNRDGERVTNMDSLSKDDQKWIRDEIKRQQEEKRPDTLKKKKGKGR